MKTITFFFSLILLTQISCVNSHKLIQEEKYEQAMTLSLNRLERGKVKTTDIDALGISFAMITLKDKEAVEGMKAGGEPSIWPSIYDKGIQISRRQKKVKPVLRRLERSGIVHGVELYPVEELLAEAAEKSAIYFYAKAQEDMVPARSGNRRAARKAYYALKRCREYVYNFKDAANLEGEMYELGLTHILIKPLLDDREADLHHDLFSAIFESSTYPKQVDWQVLHLYHNSTATTHFQANLSLRDFYVSGDGLSSSCCSNSEDIKVGEIEKKVWSEKDSCYITIIEDVIQTVSVTVTDYEQYKSASLNLLVYVFDVQSGAPNKNQTLQGTTSWSNEYSDYIGDERAMSGLCSTSFGSPSSYPYDVDLLRTAAQSVRSGLHRLFEQPLE